MKKLKRLLAGSVLLVGIAGCGTLSASTAPPEIKTIPASQAAVLDVAIPRVAAGQYTTEETVDLLTAMRAAWLALDRFYNGE